METGEYALDEDYDEIEDELENSGITAAEAGFMTGYLRAEEDLLTEEE